MCLKSRISRHPNTYKNVYLYILTFVISIVYLASCNINSKDKIIPEAQFILEKVDSIIINVAEKLSVIDFNDSKNTLLIYLRQSNSIIETDVKGKILNRILLDDNFDLDHGKMIDNIGYFSDTSIVVGTPKGYFFCNLKGELINKVEAKFDPNAGMVLKIKTLNIGSQKVLISCRSSSDSLTKNYNQRNSREYYMNYKPIILFNLTTKISSTNFGYEKGSLQRKFDYYYPNRSFDFEVDSVNKLFYILHNPDATLNVYFLDSFISLKTAIPLQPDHFNLSEKISFNGNNERNINRSLYVNSQYYAIKLFNDYLMTCYSTGIPADKYDEMKSDVQYTEYFKKYNRNYIQLYKGFKKIGGDIELPRDIYSVSVFKSLDFIIGVTNDLFIERPGYEILYVYKLKKI